MGDAHRGGKPPTGALLQWEATDGQSRVDTCKRNARGGERAGARDRGGSAGDGRGTGALLQWEATDGQARADTSRRNARGAALAGMRVRGGRAGDGRGGGAGRGA